MKLQLRFLLILLLFSGHSVWAQNNMSSEGHSHEDELCIMQETRTGTWKLAPLLGTIVPTPLDSAYLNFYKRNLQDNLSTSYNSLGNLGSPGQSRVFSEREQEQDFLFLDAYQQFNVSPDKMKFYDTQIPYTQLTWTTGGKKIDAEDRLQFTFAGNANRRFGVGTSLDYVYARGHYNSQGVSNLGWQFYTYYLGDRYQAKVYLNIANFKNQENGGIQDMDIILNPENQNSNLSDPKNILTNLTSAWNRVKHRDVYFTQRYNLGFDRTYYVSEEDSTEYSEFVPVTSFFHTFHTNTNSRYFVIGDDNVSPEGYLPNKYINTERTNDSLSYISVSNTLGITLNEGFHKYAKFGLAAYATFEHRKYTNMQDTSAIDFIERVYKTPLFKVGGELSKMKGSILKYKANAEFILSGYNAGDINVNGHLQTKIPIRKDSIMVRAYGHYKLIKPSYYHNNYFSNNYKWSNDFNRQQRARIMGEIEVPFTRTKLKAGVENLTNYIYFNNDALPEQYGGNVQVLEARLEQDFRVGILNWENDIVYQKSSNQKVLPLPDFSIYSQLYINFRIARVLQTQIGVDCYYFTKYYAPTYNPATQQFHTQEIQEVGHYPTLNVFANMKLKNARFYAMMYHVNQGLFGGNRYFLSPYYPQNPRIFKFGVSFEFGD